MEQKNEIDKIRIFTAMKYCHQTWKFGRAYDTLVPWCHWVMTTPAQDFPLTVVEACTPLPQLLSDHFSPIFTLLAMYFITWHQDTHMPVKHLSAHLIYTATFYCGKVSYWCCSFSSPLKICVHCLWHHSHKGSQRQPVAWSAFWKEGAVWHLKILEIS